MADPLSSLSSQANAPTRWKMPAFRSFAISLLIVAGATGAAIGLRGMIPLGSVALLFIVAVLLSAVFFGLWTGLTAACWAFLAYNFFFVEPILTLRVTHAEDFLALGVFMLVAGLTGSLAGRLREQATAAQERARLLEHLSLLSNALAACTSEVAAREALIHGLRQLTGEKSILVDTTLTAEPPLDVEDMQLADRALRHGTTQLAVASGWAGGRLSFYPVVLDPDSPLVAGVVAATVTAELGKAVTAAIEQSGAVIARLRLAREADEARRHAEQERLRSALLSSLSHDLKTPLATILGSVTTLRQLTDALPEAARDDLLQAIEEDARRLNTYVGNLLHMTRLQAGLDPHLDWADPRDILHGAVARLRRSHPDRRIVAHADPDLPLLYTDATLLEQALFNCLDNAAAIAPADTAITASLRSGEKALRFLIEDKGPGVAVTDQSRIFEPFQRGSAATPSGTGLGLTISKGVVLALGGTMGVDSPIDDEGGACFWLSFPLPQEIVR